MVTVDNYVACGWRVAWIMWDLGNGHSWGKRDPGKGYMWVFRTRKDAIEHRRKTHRRKRSVRLSRPFKIEGDRTSLSKLRKKA